MTIPQSSLAAVFHKARQPFELREFEIPKLNSGDVLVKIALCTVCGSDLHTYFGRRAAPIPSVLGHEIVGELISPQVVTDGAGNRVRAGERVIWSLAISCGSCTFCNLSLPQKCTSLLKYGHHAISPEWSLSGGLAEYCILRAGTFFVGIPGNVPDKVAAPGSCATATVAAAIDAAGDLKNKRVLVIGAGMLGLTACAMLDTARVRTIVVSDSNQDRARHASDFGAQEIVDARLPVNDFVGGVREATGGYGADIVLSLAGANHATERALGSLRPGGLCLLIGAVYPQKPLPVSIEDIVRRMLVLRGIYNYAPTDLLRAVTFLLESSGRYPLADLVNTEFPLNAVDKAFAFAGEMGPYRVGIRPT